MNPQRADGSWLGLLFIVGAIAVQFFKAMSRGKVEPPPPSVRPAPAYRPRPVRPEPVLGPAPARSELPPKLRDLFETLGAPGGFPPGVPRPGSGPFPAYRSEPLPAPAESLPPTPVAELPLPVPASASEAFPSLPPRHGPRLDLLRLNTRQDWERAILLSELLQPPLALRPQSGPLTRLEPPAGESCPPIDPP